jgi:predicted transcriptional regulator of viral defense system
MSAVRRGPKPKVQPESVVAGPILRTTEQMAAAGVSASSLWRAVRSGRVEQVIRGVFCASDTLAENGVGLAAISLANPEGVVCLLSAARIHEITDEDPWEVWMAIPRSLTRNPARDGPAFKAKTVWWPDEGFGAGIETRTILGAEVRVTDLARTVVDLVRYRGKLGDEVAMKALHDYVRLGGSMGDLWSRAKAVDDLKAVEPFVRAADEFKESVAVRGM